MKLFMILIIGMGLIFPELILATDVLVVGAAQGKAGGVLDIVFLGAKVLGAIAIVMGIIELLVEKDQGGQQGKKVSGSMKLIGGVMLLLAASVIHWAAGSTPDSVDGAKILGGASATKAKT